MKQIYVSLELTDREVRILVGEYFNTRFNIIKCLRRPVSGMNEFRISEHDSVLKDVKGALQEASKSLGADIEKVILVVPSYNFARVPLKVNVIPDEGRVQKDDVVRAIGNSLKANIPNNLTVIDTVLVKYTVNGISSRRIPENEVCDEMTVDIDLLCADKEITYSYVSLLEECGVEVLDVCMNSYAVCKEAALFEQALSQNLLLLNIHRSHTYLTLLNKGKLVSNEIIFDGLQGMIDALSSKYHLSEDVLVRLLKYSVDYEAEYPEDVIYAWKKNERSYSLTTTALNEDVKGKLDSYVEKLLTMCTPILDRGKTSIVVTGEGAEMEALIQKLKKDAGVDVKAYYPDTIGVRDAALTALYGAFIVYHEKANLKNIYVNCIDLLEYDSVVDHRKIDVEGETLTSRIKNLFKQYKNREDAR